MIIWTELSKSHTLFAFIQPCCYLTHQPRKTYKRSDLLWGVAYSQNYWNSWLNSILKLLFGFEANPTNFINYLWREHILDVLTILIDSLSKLVLFLQFFSIKKICGRDVIDTGSDQKDIRTLGIVSTKCPSVPVSFWTQSDVLIFEPNLTYEPNLIAHLWP